MRDVQAAVRCWNQLALGRARLADGVPRAELARAVKARRVLIVDNAHDGFGGDVRFAVACAADLDHLVTAASRGGARTTLVFARALPIDAQTLATLNTNPWERVSEIPRWSEIVSSTRARPSRTREDRVVAREVAAALARAGRKRPLKKGPRVTSTEIQALGVTLDAKEAAEIARRAVRDPGGEVIDIPGTVAALRSGAGFHEGQIDEARRFKQQVGAASYDDVTDRWDEHQDRRRAFASAADYLEALLELWRAGIGGEVAEVIARNARRASDGTIDRAATAELIRSSAEWTRDRIEGLSERKNRVARKALAEAEHDYALCLEAARAVGRLRARRP